MGKAPAFSWLLAKPLQSGKRGFESRLAHVTSLVLTMTATPERSHFKRSFGQANHFLVTIIVGLHAVKSRDAVAPPDLPAAWDPKDAARSAERSEAFAIQGAVVFLTTALDQYLADVARLMRPTSPSLASALDAAGQKKGGLRGEARVFADFSEALRTPELALVESAIHWRNRLVHPGSNARFNSELRTRLAEHGLEFDTEYRHLDPERMIRTFGTGDPAPSLKEIAGMITATHRFIRRVDSAVLENLDYEGYLEGILRKHLREGSREQAHERANRVWGRTPRRASQAIVTLAKQNGFTDAAEHSTHGLGSEALARLAGMSARVAMDRLYPDPSEGSGS